MDASNITALVPCHSMIFFTCTISANYIRTKMSHLTATSKRQRNEETIQNLQLYQVFHTNGGSINRILNMQLLGES